MDLDDARNEAVELLRELVKVEGDYHGYPLWMYKDADAKMNDLGRQFVTAQAKYTNMLREWETEDAE